MSRDLVANGGRSFLSLYAQRNPWRIRVPLHVTYRGRVVVSRRNVDAGLLLKLRSSTPGDRAEYVTVTDAEWKTHGKEEYLDKKPPR